MQKTTHRTIEVAAQRKAKARGKAAVPAQTRIRQAMNAGAGFVEADEAASAAICRDLVDGEVIQGAGGEGRRRDVSRDRRPRIWALHELRDMGHLSRDLIETAERFIALHLRLEPREKCASFNDSVSGGSVDRHRALLKRSALALHVDALYAVVAKKLSAADLAVFAMAFDASQPSVSDLKAASGRDFVTLRGILETGLTKLWSCEPITPTNQSLNQRFTGVNELARI